MKNIDFKVPYAIGTYLVKEENNRKQVDQVHEYIIGKDGISIILMLDVFENPILSNRISIEDLSKNWTEVLGSPEEIVKEEAIKRINEFIKIVLEGIPNIGDEYICPGYLPHDYDIIFKNLGCTIERYDFGIVETGIKRVKLINDKEEIIPHDITQSKIKKK